MKINKIFRIFNVYFKNTPFIIIFIIYFMKSSLNSDNFFIHLKPFTGNFCGIAHSYKLFACKYIRYDDSMFLSQFYIYLLFALAYLCIAWHIPPLVPFSTINNISISVNNSNLIPIFLNKHAMLTLKLTKNEQDQVHIF